MRINDVHKMYVLFAGWNVCAFFCSIPRDQFINEKMKRSEIKENEPEIKKKPTHQQAIKRFINESKTKLH